MQENIKNLSDVVISFVEKAIFELEHKQFIDVKEIGVSMPSHVISLLSKSTVFISRQEIELEILGLNIQPAYENVITVYCKDYLKTRHKNIPVYRLNFDLKIESDNKVNKAILDTANFFDYKV